MISTKTAMVNIQVNSNLQASQKMRVLIADDDSASRQLLQVYLGDYGSCSTAASGYKAIQAFKDALNQWQPYDLICLEIIMSEMDGLQVLKEIRRIEKENGISKFDSVKVIITTINNDQKDAKEAFNAGCHAYLIKPILREKLLEEIRKIGLIE